MSTLGPYVIICVVAAVVTCACTPIAIRLARRWGAVAEPGDRHVHTDPTPKLGGIAMFAGLAVGLVVASLMGGFEAVFESPVDVLAVALAASVIFLSGVVDDLRDVSAPAKLAGMVLAGSVLSLAGLTIVNVPVPFVGFTVLAPDLAVVATVLWVVVMANAANLIDGLDGLAAGIIGIASSAFLIYGIKLERVGVLEEGNIGLLIAAITIGICIGFLPWNFHPAKIFMGDSGALLLGLLLASSTIAVGGQSDGSFTGQSWFFFAPLVIPLVILAVPLMDMLLAIVRRASKRKGVATADKDHLHHRLMRLGHDHRRTVLILWAFTALLSAFALIPVITGQGTWLLLVALIGLALLMFTMLGPWAAEKMRDPNGNGVRRSRGNHPTNGGGGGADHDDADDDAVVVTDDALQGDDLSAEPGVGAGS